MRIECQEQLDLLNQSLDEFEKALDRTKVSSNLIQHLWEEGSSELAQYLLGEPIEISLGQGFNDDRGRNGTPISFKEQLKIARKLLVKKKSWIVDQIFKGDREFKAFFFGVEVQARKSHSNAHLIRAFTIKKDPINKHFHQMCIKRNNTDAAGHSVQYIRLKPQALLENFKAVISSGRYNLLLEMLQKCPDMKEALMQPSLQSYWDLISRLLTSIERGYMSNNVRAIMKQFGSLLPHPEILSHCFAEEQAKKQNGRESKFMDRRIECLKLASEGYQEHNKPKTSDAEIAQERAKDDSKTRQTLNKRKVEGISSENSSVKRRCLNANNDFLSQHKQRLKALRDDIAYDRISKDSIITALDDLCETLTSEVGSKQVESIEVTEDVKYEKYDSAQDTERITPHLTPEKGSLGIDSLNPYMFYPKVNDSDQDEPVKFNALDPDTIDPIDSMEAWFNSLDKPSN